MAATAHDPRRVIRQAINDGDHDLADLLLRCLTRRPPHDAVSPLARATAARLARWLGID
jgi:hypothetical protein